MISIRSTLFVACASALLVLQKQSDAFVVPTNLVARRTDRTGWILEPSAHLASVERTTTVLAAGADGENTGSKKKRRRKKAPAAPVQAPVKVNRETTDGLQEDDASDEEQLTKQDLAEINDIAKFKFQTDREKAMGMLQDKEVSTAPLGNLALGNLAEPSSKGNAIPLPDIKEARKKKQIEEETALMEQEKEDQRVRIKRTDKEAFRRLLEQQPFADADESYFEEEAYGTVSALLGERAKPFLAIPFGPLQVGHFIGSLGIVLMAFVEYPGFPLTNLPTPLRDCLQGGLGTVYAINTVLAVLAVFKAPERGQPILLWVAKTFSVGGLAYDQLMQLPTLAETEKAKAVKGKRALQNKNKKR